MKRLLTLTFAALLAMTAAAQDTIVWENPVYDCLSGSNEQFTITRVVMTDDNTLVYTKLKNLYSGNLGISVEFDFPLLRLPDGTFIDIKSFRSGKLSPHVPIQMSRNEEQELVYICPPLPRDTKWFDFLGGKNYGENYNDLYFNLYYVHDASQPIEHEKPGTEWEKTDYSKLDDYAALMRKAEKAGKLLKPANIDVTLLNYRPPMCENNEIVTRLFGEHPASQNTEIDLRENRAFITFSIREPTLAKLIINHTEAGVNCILVPGETTKILVDMVPTAEKTTNCEFMGPMAATNRLLTNAKTYGNFFSQKRLYWKRTYPEYGEFLGQTIASLPTVKKTGFAKMSTKEFERMFVHDNDLSKMSEAKRNKYLWMYAVDVAKHWDKNNFSSMCNEEYIPAIERNIDDNGRAFYRVRLPEYMWGEKGNHVDGPIFDFRTLHVINEIQTVRCYEFVHIDIWENTGQPFALDVDRRDTYNTKPARIFTDEIPYQALRGKDIIRDELIPADAISVISDSIELCFQPIDDASVALVASFGERYKGHIIVPETVTGNGKTYRVTTIAKKAFCDCTDIRSVVLPPSVTTIADSAFLNCQNMQDINLDYVESIDNYVFYQCYSLKEAVFSSRLRELGEYAFYACRKLNRLDFEEGIMEIKDYTFFGCGALVDEMTVTLPKTLKHIGERAFNYCSKITSIELPEGLVSIDGFAIAGCKSLASVKLPSTIEKLGNAIFSDCTRLTDVDLPPTLKEIPENMFRRTGFKHIVIPASIKRIRNRAFEDCSSLESVEIPEGVEIVGDYVFSKCEKLESIVLPASLKKIGFQVFELDKPHELKITCLATTPPDYSHLLGFSIHPYEMQKDTSPLYVPASALEAYKTTYIWKDFKKILPIEGK